MGSRCAALGGGDLFDFLKNRLNKEEYHVCKVPCVGRDMYKPIVVIDGEVHKQMNVEKLEKLISDLERV